MAKQRNIAAVVYSEYSHGLHKFMQSILGKLWHQLPQSEVLELLESDQDRGLDRFEFERNKVSVAF